MRWTMAVELVAVLAWTGAAVAAENDRAPAPDPTIVQALQAMGLARAEWPRIEVTDVQRIADGDKQLGRFAAFRMRGDGVIYVNARHRFYLDAKAGGSDFYPVLRLASVLRHELQHAKAEHGEADALTAQAKFLRQAMIRIPPERRSNAMAYIQSIEKTIPAAREWDRTGEYPSVPR